MGFFAYPSEPAWLGETIRAAICDINRDGRVLIKGWEECRVGGKVIIREICTAIDEADIFLADLSDLNANVMFELGYAIARNKRIWLVLDPTLSASKNEFEQLRILTTIGYAKYCNSGDIRAKFRKDEPYSDLKNTIFDRAIRPSLAPTVGRKLLYLKSLHDTEASVRISSRIDALQGSDMTVIFDDPKESTVQSLTWYGTQVYSSSAVLCHFTGQLRSGARLQNARYALVSGMAFGMEKDLLMLAEGSFLAPLDYREMLLHYQTASEARRHLEGWLVAVERKFYDLKAALQIHATSVRLATELKGLQFGEFVAENEADQLVHEYFVETASYREALEGQSGIFVGRKGSGKTAEMLKLAAELAKDRRNLVCVIKPVGYELHGIMELLRKYKTMDTKGYVVESLWKYLLYTEIAEVAVRGFRRLPLGMLKEDETNLLELLDRDSEKLGGDFSVRLERCVQALVKTQNREPTIEGTRLAVSESLHQGEIGSLRVALGKALHRKQRVAVLVDNLDKAWDKQSDLDTLAEFLLGLLSAANRLPIDFMHEDSRRLSIRLTLSIFLRTDIFYRMLGVAREPDKISASKIDWQDRELLLRVVEERYLASHEASVVPQELWTRYFPQNVKGAAAREYFARRILPRPRDLLFFVKAAVATSVNRAQPAVRETDILDAEKEYSQYALSSILVENGFSLSQMELILYEFAGCEVILESDSVRGLLSKAGVGPQDFEKLIDQLCSLSFLGLEIRDNEFRYADDPHEYQKFQVLSRRLCEERQRKPRFQVHPAFRAFLEIKEY
jgi:hypothetical protein